MNTGDDVNCSIVAITDGSETYCYPPEVRFEVHESELNDYRRAADFLNHVDVDAVCLQHEFGIYGGSAGSHVLRLLRNLRAPIVTTLHTLLKEPNADQRRVLMQISGLSSRLVVMSEHARNLLAEIYKVPRRKIDVIAHGIPDMPFVDPNFYKDHFNVEGKCVMLTFGLLSPNKGIENVIKALPDIAREFPNIVYIILGATHPHLLRQQGEEYRRSLECLANQLGVSDHVVFCNRFVEYNELLEYIGAADVYVTPYLNPAQITSGTLAYAFGCGKPVVSTPYWHAEELLADGRGVLVPFGNSGAIATEVINLLKDETLRHGMRKKAYQLGREMVWQCCGQRYLESFDRARERCALGHQMPPNRATNVKPKLPPLCLDHLRRMTDGTGMLQHACHSVPNYNEGYCIDDNARALMLTVRLEELDLDDEMVRGLATKYAAFLQHAFNPSTRRFRNFMGYDRRWLEDVGSDDSQARGLWALGNCLGRSNNEDLCNWAARLFEQAIGPIVESQWPRSWAFAVLGLVDYLGRFHGDRLATSACNELTSRLLNAYAQNSHEDWMWFENEVTYDNARLSQALISAGRKAGNEEAINAGLASLRWLIDVQTSVGGYHCPVGSSGWYRRDGQRARFDQQPVDAWATVSACLTAHQTTNDDAWLTDAGNAFHWFLGRNELGLQLYDPGTGGCRDGLFPDRMNRNQGAESTLAFLSARVELEAVEVAVPELNGLSDSKADNNTIFAIR